VAQRLELIAHGLATGMRQSIFGDPGHLVDLGPIAAAEGRVESWHRGPEIACEETAAALGGGAHVIDDLRSCDFGSWTGRSLAEVDAKDPTGLRHWLIDPRARPHGGESLGQLISRVGAVIDRPTWPDGRSVVVVSPLVVRAIVTHLLQAPAEVIFRIDVPPLGRVVASRSGDFWRVRFGVAGAAS
jgi:broad specificity phosphatase PhoE